jgi:hypothetical protein
MRTQIINSLPMCQIIRHTEYFFVWYYLQFIYEQNQFRGLQEPTVFTICTFLHGDPHVTDGRCIIDGQLVVLKFVALDVWFLPHFFTFWNIVELNLVLNMHEIFATGR